MSSKVLVGHLLDRLREVPDESVHMVVTSPPYWNLRDYGTAEWIGGDPECDHKPQGNWRDPKKNASILSSNGYGPKSGKLGKDCPCGAVRVDDQLGLEPTPREYIEKVVLFFREVRRVLRSDGTCWVNMGDCYNGQQERAPSITGSGHLSFRAGGANVNVAGLKPKDLCGMPWRLAFALQDDGWYLRQDIVWNKANPMPESVTDRCTKSHEYIFLFSKSEQYFFDAEAIKEKASTNSHTRGGGVNPKARKEGQHSRMRVDRDPRHTAGGETGFGWGRLSKLDPHNDQRERGRITRHLPGNKTHKGTTAYLNGDERQRTKFSEAVTDLVTHRNKRSVWTFATAPFKKAHFATFPPALPRFCIKAGTSEKGCCSVCGRPFERLTEKYDTGARQKMTDGWETGPGAHGSIHKEGRGKGEKDVAVIATRTIGWEESCCSLFGGHAVPCTVLDPFAGAGTTGLVAKELGRNCLMIELSPEYSELICERVGDVEVSFPPAPAAPDLLPTSRPPAPELPLPEQQQQLAP